MIQQMGGDVKDWVDGRKEAEQMSKVLTEIPTIRGQSLLSTVKLKFLYPW